MNESYCSTAPSLLLSVPKRSTTCVLFGPRPSRISLIFTIHVRLRALTELPNPNQSPPSSATSTERCSSSALHCHFPIFQNT